MTQMPNVLKNRYPTIHSTRNATRSQILVLIDHYCFNIYFCYSEVVDLWGVGTIVYTLLMGEPPFTDT